MSLRKKVIKAKVHIVWKVTSHYLKVYYHKLVPSDIDTYNLHSSNIINHFRDTERKILREKSYKIDKISYKKELEKIINSLKRT